MKYTDKIAPLSGTLHLQAFDINGLLLWETTEKNLIVASGYQAAAEALAGLGNAKITSIAVGTNGAEPTETNTAITNPVVITINRVEYPEPAKVRFHFTVGYENAIGLTIAEWGLLTADGRLFSRKVRATIEKTPYMSITGMWDIKI